MLLSPLSTPSLKSVENGNHLHKPKIQKILNFKINLSHFLKRLALQFITNISEILNTCNNQIFDTYPCREEEGGAMSKTSDEIKIC